MTPEIPISDTRIEQESKQYAAIIVMTYSSNLKHHSEDVRLSYWSAQSVHAAFHLFEEGKAPQIIIPGETIFGQNKATTAQLMARYLTNKKVPANSIRQLHDLNNTIMQLEAIKRIQQNEGLDRLLVVCTNWHITRVENTIDTLGINADVMEVEQVLETEHTNTSRESLLTIPQTQKFKEHDELMRNNLLLRQLWFQKITGKLLGPRICDLNEETIAILKRAKLIFGTKHNHS